MTDDELAAIKARYVRVLELRAQGLTFKQIGQELGVTAVRANQLLHIAFGRVLGGYRPGAGIGDRDELIRAWYQKRLS